MAAHFDEYSMAFGMLSGMGVDLANKILEVVVSERNFFDLKQNDLENIAGRKHKMLTSEYRAKTLESAKRELEEAQKKGIKCHYFRDEDFPARMLNAPDAPILFYSLGECDLNATKILSVVGTRRATHYGVDATTRLVQRLAEEFHDIVVVSGLAYGIDVSAHLAALHAGISTVGVLAHGLNQIYPAAHRSIAAHMVKEKGMLVTEYPLGTRMHRSNFLARNRIVAALSDCTVVIESAVKGGALVTAAIAESYNRDVFAFPGRANDELSAGCNGMIRKNKAQLATSAEDIMDIMQWASENMRTPKQGQLAIFNELTGEEKQVMEILANNGETHINQIAMLLGMRVHEATGILVNMEFKGYVRAVPGGKYSML